MVSEDDLGQLPLRAIVAFATRCARRARLLYRLSAGEPGAAEYESAVDRAIELAESLATDRPGDGTAFASNVANFASNVANRAGTDAPDRAATAAAFAAGDAAFAAAAAAGPSIVDARRAARAGADAADKCAAAGRAAARAGVDAADRYAARAADDDYGKLLRLNLGKYPDLGQPVDPSESGPLGPLWPDGEPEWLRGEGHVPQETEVTLVSKAAASSSASVEVHRAATSSVLPLTVYLDPGDAPQELITEYFLALSALYQAHGGSGLQFVNDERRSFVMEEVTP
jgi:hypothetical protein